MTPDEHPSAEMDDYRFDLERQIHFWRVLQPVLDSYPPKCDSPSRRGNADAVGYNPTHDTPRPDLLTMAPDGVERMRESHARFVDAVHVNVTRGSYTPGTRGLVTTAGGPYLPVLVISLRMIRRSGSNLPMEVFLASWKEYEDHICDVVLPSLNARCIVLSDILNAFPTALQVTHYQYKIFAIIFSSFEELLFVDADSFTIHNPDRLFTSEPFSSRGLITWPDFWASSASPYYYNISNQTVPPLTERASSETGEILISKNKHHDTLLLATYYNYYGPTHYYPLLSQGAPGEGDKETFLAAAAALGEPFYATSESVRSIGHPNKEGRLAGSAMVQYDPVEDYRLTSKGLWRAKNPKIAKQPRPFFIHANYPKFNPATVFDNEHDVKPTIGANGEDTRAWTDGKDTMEAIGPEVEKHFWEEIKWTGCELEDKFESWKGKKGICARVEKYYHNVYGPGSIEAT
ncbi:MAG: hypothetical protein M1819_005520 [Sarea resinae]|nr:MAG: hypothetical protein M1819_005520 [Sarea resinae]